MSLSLVLPTVESKLSKFPHFLAPLTLVSFGYKWGDDIDSIADHIIDVRGLPNPYHHGALGKLSGLDPSVIRFVMNGAESMATLNTILRWIDALKPWPGAPKVLAIGCTGGRHRSVAMAQVVAAQFNGAVEKGKIEVVHLHLDRE